MKLVDELVTIVLNYNNYIQTIKIVDQISDYGFNVILVDNASTNESWKILSERFKNKEYVYLVKSESNGGYSKGNNIGIQYAINNMPKIKYIAIINPDIELYDKNDIYKLCYALDNDDKLAGITAMTIFNNQLYGYNSCADRLPSDLRLITSNVTAINKFFPMGYKVLAAAHNDVAYVDKMQGCFFIMKKDIFEKVGFLDENVFLYFEEDILAYKIKKAGYKFGVLINTFIKHNHLVKDNEMSDLKKRKFHNKCMLESKKYYMLEVRKISKWIWILSYLMDWSTRSIKDLYIKIKNL